MKIIRFYFFIKHAHPVLKRKNCRVHLDYLIGDFSQDRGIYPSQGGV